MAINVCIIVVEWGSACLRIYRLEKTGSRQEENTSLLTKSTLCVCLNLWTFKHFQYFSMLYEDNCFQIFIISELIKQNIKHPNQQATKIINLFIVHVYSSFHLCEQKSKSESILPSAAFLQQLDNCAALVVVWPCQMSSLLPSTVGAQDVIPLGEESTAHQRHRALHTRETLAVPLPLFKRDVLSTCQAWTHTHSCFTVKCDADEIFNFNLEAYKNSRQM